MGEKETFSTTQKASTLTKEAIQDTGNPYISLDKQCLTCSGQSSVVMKAFKIA